MRILMIADGRYLHTLRWVKALRDLGLEMHLLSASQVEIEGVQVWDDEVPPWRPWRSRRWFGRRRKMLTKLYNRVRPDVIHLHFPGPYSLDPGELRGVPLLVSVWGSEINTQARQTPEDIRLRGNILSSAQLVLASSGSLAEATRRYVGLDEAKVKTLYWGVALEQFKPPSRPASQLIIGFAKHMESTYGPDVLLEAFSNVIAIVPHARLWMAGSGGMREELVSKARQLGLASCIDWAGQVAHEDMPEALSRLAVFAMPSRSESLGVAAIEAQAMQVPVVASRVGGVPEVVEDGVTGILVDSEDCDQLAAALVALLRDERRRISMGQAGRDRVAQLFNWRDSVRCVAKHYEALIE